VLHGGETALAEWAGDYRRQVRTMSNLNDLDLEELISTWSVEPGRVNVEDVSRRLTALLVPIDPGADVATSYNLLYRAESTFNTHAGIGSVGRYVTYGETSWSIPTVPTDILAAGPRAV